MSGCACLPCKAGGWCTDKAVLAYLVRSGDSVQTRLCLPTLLGQRVMYRPGCACLPCKAGGWCTDKAVLAYIVRLEGGVQTRLCLPTL